MKMTLLLTIDDIVTTKNGLHYQIETTDGTIINFSPKAMEELVNDVVLLDNDETADKVK